jgi:hypothetical protein
MPNCIRSDVLAKIMDTIYRLLALCARAECHAAHYEHLAQAATRISNWESVPPRAEAQGVGPLLYAHLKSAEIHPPKSVTRQLQGLYLRHRRANQIRADVLREILAEFETAGIQALILKGAALSYLIYPEPGLRPMSDIDLLVKKANVKQAQQALAGLGFDAPLPSQATLSHRHLTTATLQREGLLVQVEIHHQLSSTYYDNAISYLRNRFLPSTARQSDATPAKVDGLTTLPRSLPALGCTASTLGFEDMLGHLCQHLLSHINVWDYGRLIWVADVVSLAERFASEINWDHVRRQYPDVLNTLAVLHFATPLSQELLTEAGVKVGHVPKGIGVEYQGWPQVRLQEWGHRGHSRVLCDTLFPSEWWLRLHYKLGSMRPLVWFRSVRHPLHILGHVGRTLLELVGWPTALELAAGERQPRSPTAQKGQGKPSKQIGKAGSL